MGRCGQWGVVIGVGVVSGRGVVSWDVVIAVCVVN